MLSPEIPCRSSCQVSRNIRGLKKLPDFRMTTGIHSLSAFDNPEPIEFVIPYSYDYSLAKWSTSRNRIYVNSIVSVEKSVDKTEYVAAGNVLISGRQYVNIKKNGIPDFTEANRIDEINQQKFRKHNRVVKCSHLLCGPITCFMSWILYGCYTDEHMPYQYGDGSVQGSWRRKSIKK